jgi:hypothetical protein
MQEIIAISLVLSPDLAVFMEKESAERGGASLFNSSSLTSISLGFSMIISCFDQVYL